MAKWEDQLAGGAPNVNYPKPIIPKPVTPVAAIPTIPSSFTTPDINSAFLQGWKPSGNQYLDYTALTGAPYNLPTDWVTTNYPTIQSSYDTWLKAQPAPAAGVFDPVIANPDKYATTSTSGLSPEIQAALLPYLQSALGNQSGYNSVLQNLLSPASFIKGYQPIYEQLLQKGINNLSARGMLNSNVAADAIKNIGKEATDSYYQNLLGTAGAYNSAMSSASGLAGLFNQSKSINPLSGWEYVKSLFDQTMA